MARPRINLGKVKTAQLAVMVRRGDSAGTIAQALGISLAMAKRRREELTADVPPVARSSPRPPAAPAAAPKPSAAPLPSDVDAISESTPLEQIDAWLKMAKEEADGTDSPDIMAKMVRLAAQLLALKHKATPVPPIDPNTNPDLLAAAAAARKRWRDRVDAIIREHGPKE